ncbi:hypothetical protein ACFYZ9_33880 [Streptomyces sp. NPDC001691]|uniref:hypothetical protein n=1 Tax=Streptomyces sp. NPDC001691 TaxID=3364600 RepID=UPI0036B4CE28
MPDGLKLLNSNDRHPHWSEKARRTAAIRGDVATVARSQRIPPLLWAHVVYFVHPGPRTTHFDPGNWSPTVKAAVDGLVDAGVLPDDNATRLRGPDPRPGERCDQAGGRVVLVLTELRATTDSEESNTA